MGPGLGSKVPRKPGKKDSCARKHHLQVYFGKDYEEPRMLPGSGAILEDARRKALYGLVANVDDQVVLTVQTAVNYLTKYLGKIGGGQIDDIVCKMRDTETMTVASLLSRLFLHAAVPEEISSLEAWHVLLQTGYFLWTSFGFHQVPAPPPVDPGADWRWTVDSGALREGEELLPAASAALPAWETGTSIEAEVSWA